MLTISKPHRAASKDTISRWVKNTLSEAGIHDHLFKPHSVRAAATTAAQRSGVPLDVILKTAGWSNASTFAAYYNKPVMPSPNSDVFATTLLDNVWLSNVAGTIC